MAKQNKKFKVTDVAGLKSLIDESLIALASRLDQYGYKFEIEEGAINRYDAVEKERIALFEKVLAALPKTLCSHERDEYGPGCAWYRTAQGNKVSVEDSGGLAYNVTTFLSFVDDSVETLSIDEGEDSKTVEATVKIDGVELNLTFKLMERNRVGGYSVPVFFMSSQNISIGGVECRVELTPLKDSPSLEEKLGIDVYDLDDMLESIAEIYPTIAAVASTSDKVDGEVWVTPKELYHIQFIKELANGNEASMIPNDSRRLG